MPMQHNSEADHFVSITMIKYGILDGPLFMNLNMFSLVVMVLIMIAIGVGIGVGLCGGENGCDSGSSSGGYSGGNSRPGG